MVCNLDSVFFTVGDDEQTQGTETVHFLVIMRDFKLENRGEESKKDVGFRDFVESSRFGNRDSMVPFFLGKISFFFNVVALFNEGKAN